MNQVNVKEVKPIKTHYFVEISGVEIIVEVKEHEFNEIVQAYEDKGIEYEVEKRNYETRIFNILYLYKEPNE